MGRPVNGIGLPIALFLIFIIPGTFGIIRIATAIVDWDWALKHAADHADGGVHERVQTDGERHSGWRCVVSHR